MHGNNLLHAYPKTRAWVWAIVLSGLFGILPVLSHADTLDQYGGYESLHVTPTGYFTKALFGKRWLFVDPLGNAYFGKGADLITDTLGDESNVIKYTTVYVYDNGTNTYSSNLNVKAEQPFPDAVVNDKGVTVSGVGDAIYIGYGKPFNYTYFNVGTLGAGGKIQWYYSAGSGTWKLINATGNPAGASKLNADGSYNLDTGNYIVPNQDGFSAGNYQPNGNLVNWWQVVWEGNNSTYFPSDFSPTGLPNDPTPLYYIKGVVTTAFGTAPEVTQLYDSTSLYQVVPMKYSSQSGPTNFLENWYTATMQRMRAWGLNMAGDYSYRYWAEAPSNPTNRYPEFLTFPLSGYAMEERDVQGNAVKSIYDGTLCDGGGEYAGVQADVFDPQYAANMSAAAKSEITDINDPWVVAINPEEGDWIFGLNSAYDHEDVVFAIIADNPYHPTGTDPLYYSVTYTDTHLYSKYALRDYLRYEYKDPSDPLPPFTINSNVLDYTTYSKSPSGLELTALNNLNAAWGTHYTTWDTTGSGDADSANNAWGTGTGFMDEAGNLNSWGITQYIPNCGSGLYPDNFATPKEPQIAKDFNSFLGFFAQRYGSVVQNAVHAVSPHTMIIPADYDPPAVVAQALSAYVDGLEVTGNYGIPNPDLQTIVNNFNGPLIFTDYQMGNPDSPLDFGGAITAVSFDGTNTSVSFANGAPYLFSEPVGVQFPDSPGCPYYPTLLSASWTTIVVAGNYSNCLQVGQTVEMDTRGSNYANDPEYLEGDTQAIRAQDMVNQYNNAINLTNSNGIYDFAGVTHWGWSDDGQIGTQYGNFGLVTNLDNAYDGVEDQVVVSKDSNGRMVGGEDRNYGDAISTLSAFWNRLDDSSNLPGIGQVAAPQAAFTFAPSTPAAGTSVQFTDTSADDPTSWSWNFGDNSTASTMESPTHAYSTAGTYTVTLTATNGAGSNEASHTVIVSAATGSPGGSTTSGSAQKGGGALGWLSLLLLFGIYLPRRFRG